MKSLWHGFAWVGLLCTWTLAARAQVPNAIFKEEVCRRIQKIPVNSQASDVLAYLQSAFTNVYFLPVTNKTRQDFEAPHYSIKTNRLAVAFRTNSMSGVFFVRSDNYITNIGPHLESRAPVILVCNSNKLTVFDTYEIPEFTQNGYFFFYGFLDSSSGIPSLVTSVGPAGSGNYMWFFRFDFISEPDGNIKTTRTLLLEEAHIMDFLVDQKFTYLSVKYCTDKWDAKSATNISVLLNSSKNSFE